jgi:hypothetical protein
MVKVSFKDQGKLLIVLEPGNITRMKDLFPLVIDIPTWCTQVAVVATPNIQEFEKRIKTQEIITTEDLDRILKECRNLPEVNDFPVANGNSRKVN